MTDPNRQIQAESPTGKLLALDVGLARIGVAVCDPLQLRARPLTVLVRANRRQDFEFLASIVHSEEAQAIVCGLPLNMDGSDSDQTRTTRKWALRLAHAMRALLGYPLPIIFWDERLSTFAAQEIAVEEPTSVGEDAVAATVILQRYLDRDSETEKQDFGSIVLPRKQTPPATALHGSQTV